MLAATAQAQTADLPPLRPLSMVSAEAALARLPGAPTPAPRTSGTLDLRGKQVHIAEYLVLFDLAGEQPGPVRDGRLLGMPVPEGKAQLTWRATPDVAVLQALTIPDDLHAATMRSTSGLAPGEAVMAVGFPFGIGPSASQGVVSGLKREFRSPEGRRILTNLIQFDAAANPGNSGGPLITMDGHVVGIVTAIMNPNDQRTFIGIGFAVPIENAAAGAGLPPF
jgi:hypothetical protein